MSGIPNQIDHRSIDYKSLTNALDQQATTVLQTGLKTPVAGKGGVLKLVQTSGSKQEMTFEKKSWFQFGKGENAVTHHSNLLREHFYEGLQGCDPKDTEKLLWDPENYLLGSSPGTTIESLFARRDELPARRSAAGPSPSVPKNNPSSLLPSIGTEDVAPPRRGLGSSAILFWHDPKNAPWTA